MFKTYLKDIWFEIFKIWNAWDQELGWQSKTSGRGRVGLSLSCELFVF